MDKHNSWCKYPESMQKGKTELLYLIYISIKLSTHTILKMFQEKFRSSLVSVISYL